MDIKDNSIFYEGGRTGVLLIHGLGGTPVEMKKYILNGTSPEVLLWNPANLGYLAGYAAVELASKAITDRLLEEALKGDLEHDGKKYGLVLNIGGYHKNVITFAPSLNITKSEIDLAMALLDQLFTRVSRN